MRKAALFVLPLLCLILPFLGSTCISPLAIFDAADPESLIFWRLRLPRTAAAMFTGAGLALGGVVFQAMFRNPLATPYTLGVSSGAALGASAFLRFGVSVGCISGQLAGAICGCALATFMVWLLATLKGGFAANILLLAGIIINFFFSSLVMFLQYWSDANDAMQIMRWLMGSLAEIEIFQVWQLGIIVILAAWLAQLKARALDLLTVGDEFAASRGLATKASRIEFFLIASAAASATVAFAGPIGFIGIMAPQVCRFWLGYQHQALLPASMVLGGFFLALCDLASRVVLYPAELPIGIITAMLGAPFFLWQLFKSRGDAFW